MKRSSLFAAFILIFLIFSSAILNAQIKGFENIRWDKERIAPGLRWKSAHAVLNDSIPQNINILIVNLHRRRISILYNPLKNLQVSKQVAGKEALAAVNGGFFNIKEGGSVTYIRTAGRIEETDTAAKWSRNANINGAVMITSGKEVFIEKAKQNSWYDSHTEYGDVLLTGPLMVTDRVKLRPPSTPLTINRHPRTAVGIRNHRRVVLVTLDGRTNEAYGMTIGELADIMILLKCRDAVNLDGGGSTTMWIAGKPFNGVVNMPCDNRKFDHEGERASSDVIMIR